MAFRIDMSPLERSSMNTARGFGTIGRSIRSGIDERAKKQEMKDMEALGMKAMSGDAEALNTLYSKDPKAGQFIEQRLNLQGQKEQEQEDRLTSQKAMDTADFVERMHLAPKEEQGAMFEEAILDPSLDVDEDDRAHFMNPNARRALIGKIKTPEYAKSFFGDVDESGEVPDIQKWDKYQEIKEKSPEKAQEFGRMIGAIAKDKTPGQIKLIQAYTELPEGKEKKALAKLLKLSPSESTQLTREEKIEQFEQEIRTAERTSDFASEILQDEGVLDSISGWMGKIPTVTPSGTYAEEQFEQFKASLTMSNLGKMKGILSDADIKILSREASGLEVGMPKSKMKEKIGYIKDYVSDKVDVYNKKIERQKRKLKGGKFLEDEAQKITTKKQFNKLPPGSTYIGKDGRTYRKGS